MEIVQQRGMSGTCLDATRPFCWTISILNNIVPLPNEYFGRSDKPFRMRFRSTFQG
jgi:hypothetical protein